MVTKGFADDSLCAEPWAEGMREAVGAEVWESPVSYCFEESGSQGLYGNSEEHACLSSCPGPLSPGRLDSILGYLP